MEIVFKLVCSCRVEMEGVIGDGDFADRLHCECGKIWYVPRPTQLPDQLQKRLKEFED